MKIRLTGAAVAASLAAVIVLIPVSAQASTALIDTNAWYSVTVQVSGLKVDVRGAGTANGTALQQYGENKSKAQQFRFIDNGDGTYRILSALSNTEVWDVSGGGTANGTKVRTWSWAKVSQQRWIVDKASTAGYVTFRPANATSKCLDVPSGTKAASTQLQIHTCNSSASQQFKLVKVGVVHQTAGACNAFKGATQLAKPLIGSTYLPVCGPRPDWDGAKWATYGVSAYPGAPAYSGYQCVELATRWLHYRYNVAQVKANGAQVVDNYYKANPKKFTKYSNGAVGHAPRPGDVVSFSNNSKFSDYGHVGVVISSSVDSSGNGTIRLAEQNYGGTTGAKGYHDYKVSGWKVQSSFRYVRWLHAK